MACCCCVCCGIKNEGLPEILILAGFKLEVTSRMFVSNFVLIGVSDRPTRSKSRWCCPRSHTHTTTSRVHHDSHRIASPESIGDIGTSCDFEEKKVCHCSLFITLLYTTQCCWEIPVMICKACLPKLLRIKCIPSCSSTHGCQHSS